MPGPLNSATTVGVRYRVNEHDEQAALIQWAGLQRRIYPELRLLFAIPNGSLRHKVVAQKLRQKERKLASRTYVSRARAVGITPSFWN